MQLFDYFSSFSFSSAPRDSDSDSDDFFHFNFQPQKKVVKRTSNGGMERFILVKAKSASVKKLNKIDFKVKQLRE